MYIISQVCVRRTSPVRNYLRLHGAYIVGYEVCWMFFMCTVFQQDAVEQILNYMLYHLKKPKWLPARLFVGRLSQMNNYGIPARTLLQLKSCNFN